MLLSKSMIQNPQGCQAKVFIENVAEILDVVKEITISYERITKMFSICKHTWINGNTINNYNLISN